MIDKDELAKTGIHFGALKKFQNPLMKDYVFSFSHGRTIFNLDKIFECCQEARNVLENFLLEKKKVLVIGTKKKFQELVKTLSKEYGFYYLAHKWVGGFLTNFEEIRKNVKKMQNLDFLSKKDTFKLLKKKQQKEIERKLGKLQKTYEGVTSLWQIPDLIVVFGLKKERNACLEAKHLGIPIIAFGNSNVSPKTVDYLIPGNDENIQVLETIFNFLTENLPKTEARLKNASQI